METPTRTETPPVVVTTTNNPQHLQAYMQEVSMSLATEIKSEIRGVINKVEDVLSSESADEGIGPAVVVNPPAFDVGASQQSMVVPCMTPLTIHPSTPPLQRTFSSPSSCFQTMDPALLTNSPNSSISADHVAECLAELTGEMVSELKSEIREMVNQVDELISPSSESGRTNSPDDQTQRHSSEGESGTDVVEITLNPITETAEDCLKLKLKDTRRSTVNSISSQDSGINLSYHERDASPADSRTDPRDKKKKGGQKMLELCTLVNKQQKESELADTIKENLTKPRWHCPPKNIWKPTTDALKEFNMIQDGDRVLVCLSGGKDSLSLLHTLHQYQYYANSKGLHFTLGAATVDPGSVAYNPRPLIPYLQALGVHYLFEEQPILETASQLECKSICSFCSRMKRGRLYSAARREGYNVLALGQHLDDLAESFLMSTFHNGRLRSMKAHYYIRERDLRVIRPFVYVRERSLRQFAESRHLPVIPENCPACFEAPKERYRTKQLLAQQEVLFPRMFLSLKAALKPLISFNKTGEESKAYARGCLGPGASAGDDSETDTEESPIPTQPIAVSEPPKNCQ